MCFSQLCIPLLEEHAIIALCKSCSVDGNSDGQLWSHVGGGSVSGYYNMMLSYDMCVHVGWLLGVHLKICCI